LDEVREADFRSSCEQDGECVLGFHAQTHKVDDLFVPASFPCARLFLLDTLTSRRQYIRVVPPAAIV
jgi:hypothetical protein